MNDKRIDDEKFNFPDVGRHFICGLICSVVFFQCEWSGGIVITATIVTKDNDMG